MTATIAPQPFAGSSVRLVRPRAEQGAAIHRLIAECKPLDLNSGYLYLLLTHHFADTCILALADGRAVGFVSAYRPPGRADTLFVWQVAVAPQARGKGLAGRMLQTLLQRAELREVTCIETTVSPSNAASRGMFEKLAERLGAPLEESTLFQSRHFGAETHEDERLIVIGPFATQSKSKENA